MADFPHDPYDNLEVDGGDAIYIFTSVPRRMVRNSLGICTEWTDYPIKMIVVSGKFHMAFGNASGDTGYNHAKFEISWRPAGVVAYLVKVTFTINKVDTIYNYAFIPDPTGSMRHGKPVRIQIGIYPEMIMSLESPVDKTLIIMYNNYDHSAMLPITEVTDKYPSTMVLNVYQSLALTPESTQHMKVWRDSNVSFM